MQRVVDLTFLGATQGFIIQGDAADDRAGRSVSSAGDVNGDGIADLIIGAPYGDDGGGTAGEAYVIFGKAGATRASLDLTGLLATDGFIIQGDTAGDLAGFSVSSAGDINGDGIADLIVGAAGGDNGGGNAGEAYVIYGKAGATRSGIDLTNLAASDGFIIQGDAAGDRAGRNVASAGDINGDGIADLIIGAPYGANGGTNAGEAYVIYGKAGATRASIDLTSLAAADGFIIQGDAAGDTAGFSVASAGDINGDGVADLIVGAPGGDNGGASAGEAYVIYGKVGATRANLDLTNLLVTDGFIIQGDAIDDQAGFSVASAGDVNGDGIADIIVGANRNDNGGSNAGAAYVIFGKAGATRTNLDLSSLGATDGFIIQGDTASDYAGRSVASAGDVNGDGIADLIVGAPYGDNGGSNAGEAYVIFGKAGATRLNIDLTNLSSADGFIIQGDAAGDVAGLSVASARDINGDGIADLIVGARNGDNGGADAGEAYVIFGSASIGGIFPQELFLRQPTGGLVAWDSTRGSGGFRFLISVDPATTVAATADFTGDGLADIVFKQSNGGFIGWNIAQGGSGFFTLPSLGAFQPIFNGNLRGGLGQDLLLAAPDGQLKILEVETGAITDLLTLSPGFSVVGVANINGQGRDDIVFQNNDTRAIFALTDTGFVDLLTLASGWTTVGLGNVTGDAAEDFVFRNTNTGVTIFWDVGQGGAGFRDFATIGNEWTFGAFADLNGDNRDDVLLQNTNGNAIYWSGSGFVDLGTVLSQVQLVGVSELG
jgi:hypothetical protein